MANRLPLTANKDKKRIEELPAGDNLDLSQSGIVNAASIQAQAFFGNLVGVASTALYLENAENILNGIIDPNRLSGSYDINITGSADFLTTAENISAGIINPERLFGSYGIDITGTATSISVADNSNNSNHYLTFTPSTGSQSIYIDSASSLVYNPSTNRLGINTSNPSSNLHVIGNAQISGIITAASFIGDGSGLTNLPSGAGVQLDANKNFIVGNGSTTGCNNVFIGENAGCSILTGEYGAASENIFIGPGTGKSATNGYRNIFLGACAGNASTNTVYNIFIGAYAGYLTDDPTNNSVWSTDNAFIGAFSGALNTTGYRNNFFGFGAGGNNTIGYHNNFFGYTSGESNTIGNLNSFFGAFTGVNNTTGSFNSFFGQNTGIFNTTGSYNTFLGGYTGLSTSSSHRVILGSGSFNYTFDSPDINKDKQFAVGVNTSGTSEYWLVGNENFNVGIGTTNPTSKLHVLGDAKIGINTSQGVILTAPDGTSYRLIVNNGGTLSTILV